MSIATCGELKTAIAGWLQRPDLDARMLDFIGLAESRIARDLRPQRQVAQVSLPVVAGADLIALPADWLEFVRLRLAAPDMRLEYMTPEAMVSKFRAADRGAPQAYCLQGASLRLGPTPDAGGTIEATYHARLPALAADASSTWLLEQHPGIYLWGALAEASPFTMDDARAVLWESKLMGEMKAFHMADERATHSGSTLRIRAR